MKEIPNSNCCPDDKPRGFRILEAPIDPLSAVVKVSAELTLKDRLGSWKARWGINRMHFIVSPGLYSIGDPDDSAPVLVTANYKMSFDRLRKELAGLHAWILVLDTRGINVWCAAGKGTFGTAELIQRIAVTGLAQLVSHRIIILPQLGAPGVAAHEVRKLSGFKVVYGPVRAQDIPAFLKAGMKATNEMRSVHFNFYDRLVLTPIELVGVLKPLLIIGLLLLILHAVGVVRVTFNGIYPFLGAVLVGTVVTPVLLPWIPGRAFAWKGWLMGVLWTVIVLVHGGGSYQVGRSLYDLSLLLILPALSAFLAMNFTGASTYTSLSGVKREMKIAMPMITVLGSAGIILWLVRLFV